MSWSVQSVLSLTSSSASELTEPNIADLELRRRFLQTKLRASTMATEYYKRSCPVSLDELGDQFQCSGDVRSALDCYNKLLDLKLKDCQVKVEDTKMMTKDDDGNDVEPAENVDQRMPRVDLMELEKRTATVELAGLRVQFMSNVRRSVTVEWKGSEQKQPLVTSKSLQLKFDDESALEPHLLRWCQTVRAGRNIGLLSVGIGQFQTALRKRDAVLQHFCDVYHFITMLSGDQTESASVRLVQIDQPIGPKLSLVISWLLRLNSAGFVEHGVNVELADEAQDAAVVGAIETARQSLVKLAGHVGVGRALLEFVHGVCV